MSLDDPEVVRAEYASEDGLVARASVYQGLAGPDARETAFDAVSEVRPVRVLEVGCGWGEFAARIRDEVTARHLEELWSLVDRGKRTERRHFFSEDGEERLARHFASVTRRDVVSPIEFDAAGVRGYVGSSIAHKRRFVSSRGHPRGSGAADVGARLNRATNAGSGTRTP